MTLSAYANYCIKEIAVESDLLGLVYTYPDNDYPVLSEERFIG